EIIGGAGAGPVSPSVIREVEARLRAGHDVVAVTRVDPHFAYRLVLRELAWRKRQARAEDTCSLQRPGNTGVGRFKNTLTTHREGAIVKVACACIDRVMIVRINSKRVDADGAKERIVRDNAPRRGGAAAGRSLPHSPTHAG